MIAIHNPSERRALIALSCLLLLVSSVPITSAEVTECDRLAASAIDSHAVAPGIEFQKIDGPGAVEACGAAIKRSPEVARFHFQLGRAYDSLERYKEAARSYRRALELQPDYAVAAVSLGRHSSNGLGVAQDDSEALRMYRMHSDDPFAQLALSRHYRFGKGVKKDYGEAHKLLLLAAGQGLSLAERDLGTMYERGEGVDQDYATALTWFRKAADGGDSEAQFKVGYYYALGRGVDKDRGISVKYYRLAAENGHATAMANLGLAYQYGRGVPKDCKEALRWYNNPKAQDNKHALNNLGVLYEDGCGVPKDLEKAAECFRKAADKGLDRAQKNLDRLYDEGLVEKPVRPSVSSLRVAALPASVRVGQNLELILSYSVQAGSKGEIATHEKWSLSYGGQQLPNFPIERTTTRESGDFDASYSQSIPAGASAGEYVFRGEVCVNEDCISRTTRFTVAR